MIYRFCKIDYLADDPFDDARYLQHYNGNHDFLKTLLTVKKEHIPIDIDNILYFINQTEMLLTDDKKAFINVYLEEFEI